MKRKKPLKAKTPLKRSPMKKTAKKKPKKKAKKSGPSKTTLRRKADLLTRKWFHRAERCFACGEVSLADGSTDCNGGLQWCHIHTRGIGVIRWNPLNGLPMCARHHKWYGGHPLLWAEFIERLYPGRGAELYRLEYEASPRKPDPEFWIAWYTGRTDNFRTWDGEL